MNNLPASLGTTGDSASHISCWHEADASHLEETPRPVWRCNTVRVCTGTLKKFHGACLTQAGVRLPVEHLPDTGNHRHALSLRSPTAIALLCNSRMYMHT